MDDTEDIDPFAYEPLKATRKRKNPSQATQNGKRPRKSLATPAKPRGPGLVEMFSAMKKTPEKCRLPPTVCPLCQLPLELLQCRVSSRVHLEDCQDKMSETNLAPLPQCRDYVDCQSREVAHYAKFDHSELARHRDLGLHLPEVPPAANRLLLSPGNVSPGNLSPGNVTPGNVSPEARPPTGRQQVVSPVVRRRSVVPCEACRLPLGSSAEQRGHQCGAESASSQLSVSLLARPNLGPAHRLDFSSLGGQEGMDGEIIEGTSEVAGPSRARSVNNNKVDASEAARAAADSPIKMVAEKDSEELELQLTIDPRVHCTRLRLRVPLRRDEQGDSLPLSVSANYTNLKNPTDMSPKSRSSDTDSLSRSAFEEVLRRARKKGFVAPDLDMLKPVEQENKKKNKKQCPWYKIMKDTSMAVDAFNYGAVPHITHYLLSHFHSDHYVGLSKTWNRKIVCSPITKRLAISKFHIRPDVFLPVEPGEERVVAGVHLTALDANHCPGSLMFVLRTTSGKTFLHTGDFRACAEMESAPILWDSTVDRVYLDTTYCTPQYDLPSQGDVIAKTVDLVGDFVASRPGTVVLVGAYTVGKERLFKAVAEELEARVWTGPARVEVWRCLQDRDLLDRLVGSRAEAQVQVVDSKLVTWGGLGQELDRVGEPFTHVLGVRPTGWAHSRGEGQEGSLADVRIVTKGQLSLLEVPYSEHSSFSELKRFIKFLRIKEVSQIVPTVNRANLAAMEGMFGQWIRERERDGPDSQ